MPRDLQKLPRQRPVSCLSCRKRKLRCSRVAPCSNCVSRGIQCDLEATIAVPQQTASDSEIIERLNRLEQLLISKHSVEVEPKEISDESTSPVSQVLRSASSPQIEGLVNDVAVLESIYSNKSLTPSTIPTVNIVFRTCNIQQITEKPKFIFRHERPSSEPSRCIWLPLYSEAKVLLQKYLRDINHIHHICHIPSLARIFDDVYAGLGSQGHVKSGYVILLLGIFTSATHCWTREDCVMGLFSTSAQANEQSKIWAQASQDVIDVAHREASISIEGVQGTIIFFFALANIEGFTRHSRALLSLVIMLARDLGLHRIDHPSNADRANTAEAEMGRRLWWYICTSDWAAAARFQDISEGIYSCHPRQMITKKPLNIRDEDIFDGMTRNELPLSQPTPMSYSLYRIRLGEISRKIVDRTPLIMAGSGGLSHDDVMDIDTELQLLINDVPQFFSMSMSEAELKEMYQLDQSQANDLLHQRYMFHFMLSSQRCKLHLPYYSRGFVNPSYSTSREICVKSARLIVELETWLHNSSIGSASRFKFTMLQVGMFMASIVLLMDLCMNRTSPNFEKDRLKIVGALKILEIARHESETAAKFVECLKKIFSKRGIPCEHFRTQSASVKPTVDNRSFSDRPDEGFNLQNSIDTLGVSDGTDITMITDDAWNDDLGSYFEQLNKNFVEGIDVGNFDWNDMFSDLDSTLTFKAL
ncbi:hypothetical protein BT63DRAFT_452530 [Microthyrium microscopicum]|uniref:Zn(2)-C6 fungal-type domain-containing protein n=1 Tax=Microthyrium microscopicum TaxID=703497 RepID=A0A6A6UIJ4_9PEZI|nr:hypothetical protein BT63DRAFT_452530 [Microthyrium microscopicum]